MRVFIHYAEHAQRVCAAMGETTPLLQRDKERREKETKLDRDSDKQVWLVPPESP